MRDGASYRKMSEMNHWKDRAAGWCHWEITIPRCSVCGDSPAAYSLTGTQQDAEKFANDPTFDICDRNCEMFQ